jgi:hypothetical protein
MNFLAHVRVALAAGDDELLVLGSVLPDLESLLGPVLPDHHRARPEIVEGVRIHRATDAAFHADRRFVTATITLTRALQAAEVGRGASRALGHAGWELLLDGLLVEDVDVTAAFAAAIDALGQLSDDHRLYHFTDRGSTPPMWAGYADPQEVASRLHRQLARRPRLAFPADQIPSVAATFAATLPEVTQVGPSLLADVTATVARSAV